MATAALTLPKTRRRLKSAPAGGRAAFPDFYFVKQIDNSRLVREIDVERRREFLSLFGLGVLVFSFLLLLAWQHFQSVRSGYQIEQLKADYAALEEQNHTYRLEQAALADPQRIDSLARTQLKMITPDPKQLIRVGSAEPATTAGDSPEFARNFSAASADIPHEP
jgi:cell division protein FtsL